MRQIKFFMLVFLCAFGAMGATKNWDEILAKATPQEKNDLGKVLQQIRMVPAKDPLTGKSVFKVVGVEKNSVFDREGVRVGDLVSAGSWDNSGMTTTIKKTKNEEEPNQFEKLGTAKAKKIHMTQEEAAAADKSVAESFEQGFRGSSPEAQRAILKAAKELEAQKKLKAEKSTE